MEGPRNHGDGGQAADDESSLSSISDEEDWGDCYMPDDYEIDKIERNDPITRQIQLLPYFPAPSVEDWVALGQSIGMNTVIEGLNVTPDGLDEDDEIASAENLDLFLTGLSNNRSLKCLIFEDFNFRRASLDVLRPLFLENDYLTSLTLHYCYLGAEDIRRLANAFSQRRNPSSITFISYAETDGISDGTAQAIVQLCRYCPRLKKLTLFQREGSGQQSQGLCRELATMLNSKCKLKGLNLWNELVNDEGMHILADAISVNKKLRHLDLRDCDNITAHGWNFFLGRLAGKSSINATLNSNHTLERFWEYSIRDQELNKLPDDLRFCLEANREKNKANVARKKIFHFHLNGKFDLSPFLDMDLEVLPHVLGWIGKDYDASDNKIKQSRGTAIYRILCNIPELCGFPSRERVLRWQLEKEKALLKAEVEQMKQKIEQLMLENEGLKSNKRQKNE